MNHTKYILKNQPCQVVLRNTSSEKNKFDFSSIYIYIRRSSHTPFPLHHEKPTPQGYSIMGNHPWMFQDSFYHYAHPRTRKRRFFETTPSRHSSTSNHASDQITRPPYV